MDGSGGNQAGRQSSLSPRGRSSGPEIGRLHARRQTVCGRAGKTVDSAPQASPCPENSRAKRLTRLPRAAEFQRRKAFSTTICKEDLMEQILEKNVLSALNHMEGKDIKQICTALGLAYPQPVLNRGLRELEEVGYILIKEEWGGAHTVSARRVRPMATLYFLTEYGIHRRNDLVRSLGR